MGRFEELDSDSDEDQGVDLSHTYKSDELYFTGGDLGSRRQPAHRSDYIEISDDSELEDDGFEGEEGGMQLALREKEDILVARALERIRRAQVLGKTNVKLTAAESDALQRKMVRDKAKGRKPIVATRKLGGNSRNNSRRDLSPISKRKGSRPSLIARPESDPPLPTENYVVHPSSRPGSRSNSAQHLEKQPSTVSSRTAKRIISDPEPPYPLSRSSNSRRSLPDDPDWQPRSRSSSVVANLPYPVSSQDYASYPSPAIPPQYASSSRRNISGPAEFGYTDRASRQFPVHMPSVRGYTSSSDPALVRRRDFSGGDGYGRRGGSESDEDDEEDDDPDQGVQVEVQPSTSAAQGYEVSMGRSSGQRPGNTGSVRSRRGRR